MKRKFLIFLSLIFSLLGKSQLLLTGIGSLGNPILPPPPFIVAANNSAIVYSVSSLDYLRDFGPSIASPGFRIIAGGLSPASGTISVTTSTNFETYNGSTWTSSQFTLAYSGGSVSTSLTYSVRLAADLAANSYTGTAILSGANAPDFTIALQGTVTQPQFIVADGGSITTDGDYRIHSFTGDGTFSVTQTGTPPYDYVDFLVVAGGGGGGQGGGSSNGGGGAGGVLSGTVIVSIQNYAVTVGAGGAGGANGSNSSFSSNIAIGGGKGGDGTAAGNGGSGGGGSNNTGLASGGIGTAGQGTDGGDSGSSFIAGGGGGGASAPGGDVIPGFGGNGGDGISSNITGSAVYYGGGGGGSGFQSLGYEPGTGGLGGGGDGGTTDVAPQNGAPNTGGGGGGTISNLTSAASGGSGVVIIRYRYQ